MEPEDTTSVFVPWLQTHRRREDILCLQVQRTVNKDNTVQYGGKCLSLPRTNDRASYAKVKVRVHEYQDNTLAVFHGPQCVGRCDAQGDILATEKIQKQAAKC